MLKLLIVDDEPLARNGMLDTYDWSGNEVEIVGGAGDGMEAMALIERHRPDIVLTDIKMPGKDGLELAAWIRENHPSTAVIILTGYSDFEYARSALELEASHYLLKPVEEDVLFKIIGKIRKKIVAENERKVQYKRALETLHANMPVLRERFIFEVLKGRVEPEAIASKAGFYDLNLNAGFFIVLVIEFSMKNESAELDIKDREIEKIRIINALSGILCGIEARYTFNEGQNSVGMVICIESNDSFPCSAYQNIRERLDYFKKSVRSRFYNTTIGISSIHPGTENLPRCYSEACEALTGKVYIGEGTIISFKELRKSDDRAIFRINSEKLRYIVLSGDLDSVKIWLGEYFDFYKKNYGIMVRNIQFIVFELISELMKIIRDEGYIEEFVFEYRVMGELARIETLDGLSKRITSFYAECMEKLEALRRLRFKRVVYEVKEYVSTYYMKDINLKTVASTFSMNPSYLSRIFSLEFGLPFTDYLTSLRMQKAKEMLENSDWSIYSISSKVGYANEKYFSRLFKKKEGIPPQEYRELQVSQR